MKITALPVPGCYLIQPNVFEDKRGVFVKTFHSELYKQAGLRTDFKEEYFSFSKKNVLRGMHFQIPPHDHAKLVYCLSGQVEDVFVDIRKTSPTYTQHQKIILDSKLFNILYLPKGIAHGFLALENNSLLVYKATSVYSPEHDCGIRWNSCKIKWSSSTPVLSDRDAAFPSMTEFETPFA